MVASATVSLGELTEVLMSEINTGTGEGLLAFLDWLADKAEINPATARAWRISSSKVLELEDSPASVRIADVDVDQLLVRFEHKTRSQYTTTTMNTYKSRFRQAVTMYLAYLAGDSTWRQTVKSKTSTQGAKAQRAAVTGPREGSSNGSGKAAANATAPDPPPAGDLIRLVTYDLPLRPDLIVRMNLPVELTPADAARIAAFVRSLAFEIPGGNDPQRVDDDQGSAV